MIKRMRTLDVPKFRRPLKNRARLGESVYFSPHNLIYLKFIMMWLGCIALDFIIGFRFELLWPVWLLIRHLYESFRVHAFSSSLHYSAFSVFFVCVTATSDLVCYLFIPIQVLIFLASTYVWMQFVYQSTERGICIPSLVLWTVFLMFEYSMRYRFENATWYLTRSSWITAGLFPSTADNVSIGSASNGTSALLSPRFELYRPFAAHCIGFPVVTLGFRVKSFFSKWRMRMRREEVMRQNEFFERLLVDAIPSTFDNRHHFISSSRRYLALEQDALDHEFGSTFPENGQDSGRYYSQLSSSYAVGGGIPLAICGHSQNAVSSASLSAALSSGAVTTSNMSANTIRKTSQKAFTKSMSASQRQNNQYYVSQTSSLAGVSSLIQRRNGIFSHQQHQYANNGSPRTTSSGFLPSNIQKNSLQNLKQQPQQQSSIISYSLHSFLYKLWRILIVARLLQLLSAIAFSAMSSLYEHVFRPVGGVVRSAFFNVYKYGFALNGSLDNVSMTDTDVDTISSSLYHQHLIDLNFSSSNQQQQIQLQQDDLISSSGDGSSHVGGPDDYESDKEERLSQYTTSSVQHQNSSQHFSSNSVLNYSSNAASSNKKKARRARGRTPATITGDETEKLVLAVNGSHNHNINITKISSTGTTANSVVSDAEKTSQSTIVVGALNNGFVACNGNDSNVNEKYTICNGSINEEVEIASARENHSNSTKNNEIRQLYKEKDLLETCISKLNDELKLTRSDVLELRTQLSQAQQCERIAKGELVQCRTRMDQLDSRYKQLAKHNEQVKTTAAGYEKRVGELQARKSELERELASERQGASAAGSANSSLNSSAFFSASNTFMTSNQCAQFVRQMNKQELISGFTSFHKKVMELEREMKDLRRHLRTKEEEYSKVEDEIRQIRRTNLSKQQFEEKPFLEKIETLRQKNFLLEQTLSSENRLKQDLFRALNDSKAQIETLNVRLHHYEQNAIHENGAASSVSTTSNNIFDGNNGGGVDFSAGDDFLQFVSGGLMDHHHNHYQQLANHYSTNNQQLRQNSSPLGGCSGNGGMFEASKPISPLAVANLEQLMQATGAQHMSYSFAPFESNYGGLGESTKSLFGSIGNCNNGVEIPAANLSNGGAVGSSRKSASKQQQSNSSSSCSSSGKTIGEHRSNRNEHHNSVVNGSNSDNSKNTSPTMQQQQQKQQQATAKAN